MHSSAKFSYDAKEKCTQCLHMHNSAMFPRSAWEKLAWVDWKNVCACTL